MDYEEELATRSLILAQELFTRAGMLMEDASPVALLRDTIGGDLKARIATLQLATNSMSALVSAAGAPLDC